jgi:hypothetical protein
MNEYMLLSPDERVRFAKWCRQESTSYDAIDAQLATLGPHCAVIVEHHADLKAALLLVAQHIACVEEVTIEGKVVR